MGQERGVTVDGWGAGCKVQGRSGARHLIDVLTSHSDGIHRYQTAIECKHLNKKVTKEVVMKVASIRQDAGLSKGVIVTTVGYTDDAVKMAKAEHIELVTLRRPTDEDWRGRLRNVEVGITLTFPELVRRVFTPAAPVDCPEWLQCSWCSLKLPDGSLTPVKLLEQDFLESLTPIAGKDIHSQSLVFNPPAWLLTQEASVQVTSLLFEGRFRTTAPKKVTLKGDDHVAYIMRTDFGTKRHIVDPNGQVLEKP